MTPFFRLTIVGLFHFLRSVRILLGAERMDEDNF